MCICLIFLSPSASCTAEHVPWPAAGAQGIRQNRHNNLPKEFLKISFPARLGHGWRQRGLGEIILISAVAHPGGAGRVSLGWGTAPGPYFRDITAFCSASAWQGSSPTAPQAGRGSSPVPREAADLPPACLLIFCKPIFAKS